MYMLGMEKEMLKKGLLSKEQDEALDRMLRKGGQENTWNGSKKLLFTNPYKSCQSEN